MHTHQTFINTISALSRHYRQLERQSGAAFNLFRVLGVGNEELKHSLFLAELLSPNGTHGQGAIFLQLFTDMLSIHPFQCETAVVEVEKSIGRLTNEEGGRIDIYISDNAGNNIVIENKIYAKDQPKQLFRYYQYAPQHVLYLTPDGHEPENYSIQGEQQTLVSDQDFVCISYQTHILQWLELCIKETATLPLIREGISHYINQIKHITGQSENKAMNKELIDTILQTPDNLRSANDIANRINESKAELQWRFWEAMRKALEKEGLILEDNPKNTVNTSRTWNFYVRKDKYYGLWVEIFKKDGISVHWGIEIEDDIYSGFTVEKNGVGAISNQIEYSPLRLIVSEAAPGYTLTSDNWLGWKYINPYLNFRAFNSDAIFGLADAAILENMVSEIAQATKIEIDFVVERSKSI